MAFPRRLAGLIPAVAVALVAGCGPATTPTTAPPKDDPAAHSHPTVGPSGGTIVEWGEEVYHLEFLADRTTGTATVYVLDGTAKKVKAIPSKSLTLSLPGTPPVAVTLDPKPQDGDAAGQSSRFVGKHDALKNEALVSGSISGEVGGEKYSGDFTEKPAKKK